MEQVSYHRLARRELNEAARYYDSESPGLGSAFLDEVERCTQAIVNFPEAGPLIIGTIRRRLVLRFPYALLNQTRQIASACGHESEAPTSVLGRARMKDYGLMGEWPGALLARRATTMKQWSLDARRKGSLGYPL